MTVFEQHVESWRTLMLEADRREDADAYYNEHLREPTLERTRQRYIEEHGEPHVDVLVSTSGLSPMTTISATYTLRPRYLVVLHSRDNTKHLNTIITMLTSRLGVLEPAQIKSRLCRATSPDGIYSAIRQALDEAHELFQDKKIYRDYIDITGGKKVMSAASALVAWQLNLNICYIDSEYDALLRRPHPGTERMIELGNPVTIFGEQETAVGIRLFDAGNHTAAHEHFDRLANRLAEPARARAYAELSELYASWCALDLEKTRHTIPRIRKALDAHRLPLHSANAQKLRAQLAFLDVLTDQGHGAAPRAMITSSLLLGQHYAKQGRHDFAAMLLYRSMESTLHHRLLLYHHIDSNSVAYDQLDAEKLARWDDLSSKIFTKNEDLHSRPPRLGFMASATLLVALDDELLGRAKFNTPGALGHLRDLSEARNRSILAHGYSVIHSRDVETLQHHAQRLWEHLEELHPTTDLALGDLERLRFIRLGET